MKTLHWRIPFQSLLGRNYVVEIYDENSVAEPVTLLGGAVPFETETDNDEDFFCPVRTSTGYLRVIDQSGDGSLLELMMPRHNKDKFVRLVEGTTVRWQGVMQSQAFTQQIDKNVKEIEFPIRDIISCLYDYEVSSIFNASDYPLVAAVTSAMSDMQNSLLLGSLYDKLVSNEMLEFSEQTQNLLVDWSIYFDEKQVNNGGNVTTELTPKTYGDIIEDMCRYAGLTLYAEGKTIYLVGKDYIEMTGSSVKTMTYTYTPSDLVTISTQKNTDSYTEEADIETINLPQLNMQFRGVENNITYTPGARKIEISAALKKLPDTISESTPVPENTNQVRSCPAHVQGQCLAQTYSGFMTGEEYAFSKARLGYNAADGSYYIDYASTRITVNDVITQGVFYYPYKWYEPNSTTYVYAGAVPCRYGIETEQGQRVGQLIEGRLLQLIRLPLLPEESAAGHYLPYSGTRIYRINSAINRRVNRGYINVDMNAAVCAYTRDEFGNDSFRYAKNLSFALQCELRVGNKYFVNDGTTGQWQDNPGTFYLAFVGGRIATNKPGSEYKKNSGLYIPLPDYELSGTVQFSICCVFRSEDYEMGSTSAIFVDSINVSNVLPDSLTIKDRDENRYTALVSDNFSETITSSSDISTMNNNRESPSNLRTLEEFVGTRGFGITNIKYMIGENMLLQRMKNYYGKIRRKLEMDVEIPTSSSLGKMYQHGGKPFAVVAESRNWRDDVETMTLLECSQYNNSNI